jgi:S-formylglutathione hydrolase FrmB
MTRLPSRCLRPVLLAAAVLWAHPAAAAPLSFHLTFDPGVSASPFTGRVYVLLSRKDVHQLPSGPDWFHPEPFFALNVKDWRPGQVAVLDGRAVGYPHPLAKLPPGTYTAQAVMDFDRGARSFSTAEGNGYSRPLHCDLDPATSGPVEIRLDQVWHEQPFRETPRVRLVDVPSKLLSAFYARPTHLRAGVVLPASYSASPRRRYPVVYEIPGFGGSHSMAFRRAEANITDLAGTEALWVVLDPGCRLGHHVFADSANNGPCGRALVEELIPAVEARFRTLGPRARLVTGHSSGGWSSLWLQVTYPDQFAGVWSTAPDPVAFHDFQRMDLYRPGANLFTDEQGKPRAVARSGNGVPNLFFKDFSAMEEVMGHGGQVGSFEAVFSPRGPDGRPRRLWDRATGAIDPETARAWQRYDIRLLLERNWPALAPKLAGKLHVYAGGNDTFFLEGAVALLKQTLARLGSDAVVEVVPGRTHGTLVDPAMRQRIAREMAGRLRQAQAQ